MTSNASPLLRTVDEMLLDAGETDPRLRATLLSLGAFAALPVPEPSAQLAALLSAQPSQLARHRLLRRHRTAAVGLAVIAGMGLGVTGVAATASAPRLDASGSIQHMLKDWAPSWTIVETASPAAGNPPGASPAEPGSPEGAAPGSAPEESEHARPGAAEPGTAPPQTVIPGDTGQENGAGRSQPTGRSQEPGRNAGIDAAGKLEEAGRKVAGAVAEAPAAVGYLTSAIPALVTTEKTGAGNAGPGSIWLQKFGR